MATSWPKTTKEDRDAVREAFRCPLCEKRTDDGVRCENGSWVDGHPILFFPGVDALAREDGVWK
jgi:hypothetical protein